MTTVRRGSQQQQRQQRNGYVLGFCCCLLVSQQVYGFSTPSPPTTLTTTTTTSRSRNSHLLASNGDIYTLLQRSTSEDDEDDSASARSARAGMDGYSVMRQPLSRDNWNPQVDPNFDAPARLLEDGGPGGVARLDNVWWSDKQQQVSKGKNKSSSTRSSKTGNYDKDDEDEPPLDLFQRSVDTLDFPFVLNALRGECFTSPARKMVQEAMTHMARKTNKNSNNNNFNNKRYNSSSVAYQPLIADTMEGAVQRYAAVQEIQWLLASRPEMDLGEEPYWRNRRGYRVTLGGGNPPPLEGLSFDLDTLLDLVDTHGQLLEGPEILEISTMMDAMEDIQCWSQGLEYIDTVTFAELPKLCADIQLNTTLQELLAKAFDQDGKLSGSTFPVLGRLRAKVRSLKRDILQTLDALVTLPSIQSKLALESGGPLYSEIGNGRRLVLPIAPKYASSIGIVHDSSRSGKTVFVEPSEIVGPTNELRQAEGELRAEEARVWRLLTEQVLINRRDLEQSIRAVGQLDLALARCLLGQKFDRAQIPLVKSEGVISLASAKHPVLLLRKVDNVVGSDIELGSNNNQGLVLTGPNAGGKTVILKLLGLMALMARSGIPVPASEWNDQGETVQPRVDFFDPVLADIGDMQTVGGDLSTFSGHMLVCREVLSSSGENAMVLMDELGSGTDPKQGVAIAQAILESLVDTGCRVAITTHYMELKQLAASDPRFAVGGMQFVRGQPTYKLLPGTVGESFAMAVAERLQLPRSVIDRATALLDSETRQMGDLIRELEDQKAKVEDQIFELEAKKREIGALEITMKEEKIKLERKMLDARRVEAKKFAKKLEEKELVLEQVLEKLKSDPSRKVLAKSWDDIRFVRRDALDEAENVPSVLAAKKKAAQAVDDARADLVPLAEFRELPELKQGDKLIVCKTGPLLGREAILEKVMGKRLEVKVQGMNMALTLADVAIMTSNTVFPTTTFTSNPNNVLANFAGRKSQMSKAAEKALMAEGRGGGGRQAYGAEQSLSSSQNGGTAAPTTTGGSGSLQMRMESNTIDVRGCNLEEAKERAKAKFSQCIMTGRFVVFILHGHGTGGVLKSKIRDWLKSERQLIKKFSPAEMADGGDAFTRVELR
jgi:DNA mismatch repair protein MutS2